MDANKVTFGFKNVHIAFKGVAQAESIEILTAATADGEITVTVTSANIETSPVSVIVPLASETHNTATKVASTIVNALNNNSSIAAVFKASHLGGVIKLTAKTVAVNDSTLDIAITVGLTGITAGTSTEVTAGDVSWGVPRKVPGAIGFTPATVGESTTFYADDGPYFVITSNNGYTADLEMANVPDTIKAEMLGWEIDNNGMLVEIANAQPKNFAMMGEVTGDKRNRRFVYYDCVATRPAKAKTTKGETTTPNTDVLSLTIAPIEINNKTMVKGDLELSDTNAAVFNNFFNAVYTPTFS